MKSLNQDLNSKLNNAEKSIIEIKETNNKILENKSKEIEKYYDDIILILKEDNINLIADHERKMKDIQEKY